WRSKEKMSISEMLSSCICSLSEDIYVSIDKSVEEMAISPWIHIHIDTYRPSNIFYRYIFFELMKNAAKHDRHEPKKQLEVALDRRDPSEEYLIVFKNKCEYKYTIDRLRLEPDRWLDRRSRVGDKDSDDTTGLSILESFLEITKLGSLFI